ncbi:MAG TPA: helix-turn-helix domain-containing protein [Burkholderiaceae bacterium]|nr:helix-turn-helix domain-containing protein [Burkholderiaceae bacterium]
MTSRQDGTPVIRRHSHVTKAAREHLSNDCGRVSEVLSRIGDKWTVLVVMMLRPGPRRFSELKREINGISQRMLTLTLRGLERDGMVTRTVYPSVPPRVDYELTAMGHSLREPVEALGAWAFAHLDAIDSARSAFDARTEPDTPAPMARVHRLSDRRR